MTLKASGTLKSGAKIKYLPTLVWGESLHQFYTFSVEFKSASPENLSPIVLGLGEYFPPVNYLSNTKHVMRLRMRKPHSFKIRRYATRFI